MIVSSFYKYVEINKLEEFQKEHQEYCKNLGIKGKILIANEGINGSISGTEDQIKEYELYLNNLDIFSDIKFKRTNSDVHPFRKIIVRIRKEIVTSNFDVNVKNTAKHLNPKELKKMLDNNEELIFLDARNDYESKIGKFKNAITPKIKTFKEFKNILPQLKVYKNKKIVMYCTGGVRCEKASALLVEDGFKDVNQIDGGIFNFVQQYPDTYFEGRCFVFDDRLSISTGTNNSDISICELCHFPCGRYINCTNKICDKLFICCEECDLKSSHTCSKQCINKIKNA